MKKSMLVLLAVLATGSVLARQCGRSCQSYVNACDEPEAPICKVPCVTYKEVAPIRHVSYSCPTSCLTEQQVDGHTQKIITTHNEMGIEVQVEEVQ